MRRTPRGVRELKWVNPAINTIPNNVALRVGGVS